MSIRHTVLGAARSAGLNRTLRSLARRWPFPVPAEIAGGGRIWVDLRSTIGQGLYVTGDFDPNAIRPAIDALPEGGVFLDIGANIGYYSVLAARKVGPRGRVFSFEMDPRPLRCLRRTIRSERLDGIQIVEAAVSDVDGVAHFEQAAESGHNRIGGTTEGARSVRSVRLDSWVENAGLDRVDVIKIDVEGAERLVLEGARRTLERFRPVIVCESSELARKFTHDPGAVVGLLTEAGYATEWLTDVWSPTLLAKPLDRSAGA